MPNKRSDDRKRVGFWVSSETSEMLDALAKASRRSKTQVVEYLLEAEHQKRKKLGQLKDHDGLFPDEE